MTLEQNWAKPEKNTSEDSNHVNGFAEAYDYIQAQKLAKGLEKKPDLQSVDETLKKMNEHQVQVVVDMANYDLTHDKSKLHLELELGAEGCMDIFRTFNLKLVENGKEIDSDKWRGRVMKNSRNCPDFLTARV
jgi:hypothetical protein